MVHWHKHLDNAPVLFLPEPPPVFVLPGQQQFAQDPFSLPQPYPHSPSPHAWDIGDGAVRVLDFSGDATEPRGQTNGLQKKTNQWCRWSQDIIPALIAPYLVYLQQTEQLCLPTDIQATSPDSPACTSSHNHSLTVMCVLFDYITIKYGPCHPAPVVLISWGLFPSSPVTPSIAINLTYLWVLELVKKLVVQMTPNTTAFDGQGYELKTKVSETCGGTPI
ncbi:hypothetical protein PAXRUDRAFT_168280 [Paxillus rubicundulus Ve08.2h10]|uniref:Uncharacterized protein n=1 Tax=Paxillus rubicundulus Ve08.2h10 TaxID=930991 RepID=A0A0D0DGF0_9AGAM|nr:hypothetical protein PAXRUDRAFT_168280 [Paxillus rubicundulus Ve08.2h10]